ncbi:hypothetical protein NIES4071_50090 [Calothrix sp. NIES-4071]|nr:hypothetical protein NIES4071_50090 [Calothrix sp. NIES-4071]BAZ59316.1 hypothetical protein NIES4105_50030 [Calothrix sp. NIES-4105]
MFRRFWNRPNLVIILLLGVWLVFDLVSHLEAEILWFHEVGYSEVFRLRLNTQLLLWCAGFFTAASFLLANLTIAKRLSYQVSGQKEKNPQNSLGTDAINRISTQHSALNTQHSTLSTQHSALNTQHSALNLRFLLPAVICLSVCAGIIFAYYAQETLNIWHLPIEVPKQFQLVFPLFKGIQISISILQVGLLVGITLLILIFHFSSLLVLGLFQSLLLGFLFLANWDKFLQFFHFTHFNLTEPLFGRDIGFYVFSLPIWQIIELFFLGIFLYNIVAVSLIYLRSANSLSEGRFPGFSIWQSLHLNILASLSMFAVALQYWLLRYWLLLDKHGVNFGASYTDSAFKLPIYTVLSWSAFLIAVYLLLLVFVLYRVARRAKRQNLHKYRKEDKKLRELPYGRNLVYTLTAFSIIAVLTGELIPTLVQRLLVQPNELTQERPYIQRTIALTRQAFNLDDIEEQNFAPQGTLTAADLKQNDLTIRNIRLWDTNPLLDANRQLQQIRPYYNFPSADIDRYTLRTDVGNSESEKQQTIIAARELDSTALPEQAKTWINQHLIYTHGYGFTLSPVNIVGAGGLPEYYVKDIGVESGNRQGSLQLSDENIRVSIPIGRPRIYYGEITNNYVMTGTKTQELDYPSGNDNFYNVYDGRGGVPIGQFWKRLIFAEYLKDWQMLLTRNFTPQTKLLFRRNIMERVKEIAPFLHYDSDSYLVAADGGATTSLGEEIHLYWIIDAYTTSNTYPYSDPGKHEFNYIRNSVKVIVDTYNGSVNFYVADKSDPIITTLTKVFPSLFKPLSAMSSSLVSHLRYPVDLFNVKTERLLTYHMTDPQVFYNREDLWQIPNEIYGTKPRTVEPYYLITKLPTAKSEEFILLLPFTPTQRPNLIAWLAARSDGNEYGKLLLYKFPKQQLVYGQEQIDALINQDPVISQQITLWNREGSRVIQGNLLIIPIEQSLLYVEPIYLEAEQNSVPTLVRVVVAYQNRIVMAPTLDNALTAVFQPTTPTPPAIVRPVQ